MYICINIHKGYKDKCILDSRVIIKIAGNNGLGLEHWVPML